MSKTKVQYKACPSCAENIKREAKVCVHCGEDFSSFLSDLMVTIKTGLLVVVFGIIVIGGLVLGALMLLG